jgi:pseudouridine kinase
MEVGKFVSRTQYSFPPIIAKLSRIKAEYESDYEKLVAHFLDLGVKKVFITLGPDGVAFGTKEEIFISKNRIITPVNTNGAGDALMAGLIYGETKGLEIYDMVKFASACALVTIQHKNAVHPEICVKKVKEAMS